MLLLRASGGCAQQHIRTTQLSGAALNNVRITAAISQQGSRADPGAATYSVVKEHVVADCHVRHDGARLAPRLTLHDISELMSRSTVGGGIRSRTAIVNSSTIIFRRPQ